MLVGTPGISRAKCGAKLVPSANGNKTKKLVLHFHWGGISRDQKRAECAPQDMHATPKQGECLLNRTKVK